VGVVPSENTPKCPIPTCYKTSFVARRKNTN
jgi:hypothetical protein